MDQDLEWVKELPAAITVTDKELKILFMNDKAAKSFDAQGGRSLVGSDLMACHTERSQTIIARILAEGKPNVYTIEKKGVKKLIYQTTWTKEGEIAGLVELSLEIPAELPHFKRD